MKLFQCSVQRQNNTNQRFLKCGKEARVHDVCQKQYVNEIMIEVNVRRGADSTQTCLSFRLSTSINFKTTYSRVKKVIPLTSTKIN